MRSIGDIIKQVESTADFAGHQIDSINYTNGYGDSMLHIASCWGDCDAIKILISEGASINLKGETGFTALHCAAEQNHPGAIKLLLYLGADPAITNSEGLTPLELAKEMEHHEIVSALS